MGKRLSVVLLVLLTCVSMLTGCMNKQAAENNGSEKTGKKFASLNDFSGEVIGFEKGASLDMAMREIIPDYETKWMNDLSSGIEEVKSGKAAAFVTDLPVALNAVSMNPELAVFPQLAFEEDYAWCFPKNSSYLDDFNKALAQLKADGTLDEINSYWIESKNADKQLEPQKSSGENGKIIIGGSASMEPMVYMNGDGEIIGREVAVCNAICDILGLKAEYVNVPWDALAESIDSGKIDLFFGTVSVTEERKQIMDFCDTTYSGGAALIVRKDRIADSTAAASVYDDSDIEEKLAHAKIGSATGTLLIDGIRENYPEAEIVEFNDFGNAVEALKSNKVDYVITSRSMVYNYARNNKELYVIDQNVLHDTDTWAYAAVRKGYDKLSEINEIINRFRDDGTSEIIESNWLGENAPYDLSGIPVNKDAPKWKVGISADSEPTCFLNGEGEYCGVDCETAMRIAYEMGMQVEFVNMDFSALLPALQSGKVDFVIADMGYTEERAKVIDFTAPYLDDGNIVLAKKSEEAVAAEAASSVEASEGFIDKLKASFTRTFITENRWKLVLNGLGVTIVISLCAFVIGSLWGGVICAGLRSNQKIAAVPARIYVRLLQGTPIVVLLMILYYIVFKSFDISAVIVAIIGFSLNLGAYTSEIFRTAIDSVDKGQIEAASAIGFSKFKVFTKIIFPQAARNALPVYKGEFISLVKSTSIVGYIAIQDLTKASDIIRSRTYEAFFPLITTAIIYFVVTYIFIVLLNILEKKIDPKRRKRTLKGVDIK
ncbi:MAG: ABC transporter permease subunit [Oscillospiraceae bacterium]